jgi:hypothetical protein
VTRVSVGRGYCKKICQRKDDIQSAQTVRQTLEIFFHPKDHILENLLPFIDLKI